MTISCKKKLGEENPIISPDISDSRNRIAAVTKEVSDILEKVYEDNRAYSEVNAAIYSGYYEDERVLLKDLLFPETSDLYRSANFRAFKVDTGIFRKRFCEIIEKGRYPLISSELAKAMRKKIATSPLIVANEVIIVNDTAPSILSAQQPLSIYFPYSENFVSIQTNDSFPLNGKLAMMKKATIVYTDREADSAPGREPYICSGGGGSLCYRDVTVDDDFAEIRPAHIITFGADIHDVSDNEIPKTELVSRIYHGSSKLTKQLDKLISLTGNGGGSEIKVCRINGYLNKRDEQITNFEGDVVTVYYTRADIRKRRWKRVFSVWDPNWNYQDIEQIYAVYEDDTQGSKTLTGSLTTTMDLPAKFGKVVGDLGFKIEVLSQDEIITQRKLDRKSYFRDGLNNQGWGFLSDANDFLPVSKDWPVLDGGSIWQYTLAYRIY
jgi:hypothetical protein